VIDNFEDVLNLEARQIADAGLAGFYRTLATGLTQGSRVILTCRYLPAGTPADLSTVMHLPLIEFAESDFRKFLRRDGVVEARIAGGELTANLLHSLYQAFGGTPGFLDNVRKLLRTADPDALRDDLEGVLPGALSEAREAYYQRIITSRLYEALPPDARDAARRLAVSELPLPADAVAKIVEAGAGALDPSLNACIAFGLLQRYDEADRPSLYHPPGLLRPWLSAPERLPEQDARAIDRQLAAFWRSCFESDREDELRVPIDVELAACRVHARRGGDLPIFRWATVRLSWRLRERAEWFAARALLNEVPHDDHDAESLRSLARVENLLGEWKTARSLLERARISLAGDSAGEAATWHQLASIDLEESDYPAAREKFAKALATRQAIGDRAGEAASFFQLGLVACKLGHSHDGAQLIAICFLIDRAIGHGDARSAFRSLAALCKSLGYDQARLDAVLEEAGREHVRDRGRVLIERAFAGGDARDAGGPVAASGPKGLFGKLRSVLWALASKKRQRPQPL
jgi:tetratricopeptide (TPR) repeat protein